MSFPKHNIIIAVIAILIIAGGIIGVKSIGHTNTPAGMLTLAERYLSEMDYEQAIIEFEKVLVIEPRNIQAYIGLSKAYEQNGQPDKAVEVLERGIREVGEPDNAPLVKALAELRERLNPPVEETSTESETTTVTTEEITPEPEPSTEEPTTEEATTETITTAATTTATTAVTTAATTAVTTQTTSTTREAVTTREPVQTTATTAVTTAATTAEPTTAATTAAVVVSNARDLNMSGKGLTNADLVRIANQYPNLAELDISDNNISDITPLTKLSKLTTLYLNGNRISNIKPLANMTKLEVLILGDNPISDYSPVRSLPNFQEYWIGY